MTRSGVRLWPAVCFVVVSVALCSKQTSAASLDKDGDIKLGVRAYVNTRVGTENTHDGVILAPNTPNAVSVTGTFPHSDAGHVRQMRAFIEAELNHDLDHLLKQGFGPLSLLNDLPFKIKDLGYHVTFRGEGDGLYDWGPNEYSTAVEFYKYQRASPPNFLINNQPQAPVDVTDSRKRLRHYGVDRERLFQAYGELTAGRLFVRFGRQILSWGETDGFRLLDNINPLDSSFGGFLISLDERRVPLDMLRTQFRIGDFGPFQEMFLESYAAIDNKVGYYPGTPVGSPWALPSLGAPNNNTTTFALQPARTVNNTRGGARLVFNALDATFSVAHYYTYFDTPALQIFVNPTLPGNNTTKGLLSAFNDGLPCNANDPAVSNCGAPTHAVQSAPKVQVSGVTTTFAVPQFYSVVRSELAYFKDEPQFSQGQLDPFIFSPLGKINAPTTGGRRLRDSINYVIGFDINQWVRALNPNQTFFISTQFFLKHILDAAGGTIFKPDGSINPDRDVLPITLDQRDVMFRGSNVGRLNPIFVTQPTNQYLTTLFIGTSYRSGTINPGVTFFYDWGGAFLYQPGVAFTHDPFRFIVDYSIIDAHMYKGGSGVSLLKDRDNVQFRFEYVI